MHLMWGSDKYIAYGFNNHVAKLKLIGIDIAMFMRSHNPSFSTENVLLLVT